jgi:hypothetical protein
MSATNRNDIWIGNSLVGVVHVVLNGVNAGLASAAVAALGAARSRRSFERSVVNEVAVTGATSLEGVVHCAMKSQSKS